MVAIYGAIYRIQPATHTLVMATGAILWLAGNALWLGSRPVHRVAPWWAGFLVLTIVGERIELTRVLRPTKGRRLALLAACLLLVAGGLWLAVGHEPAGVFYDAMLHAVFVGFVMAMIFGHAPVILPSVLGIPLQFHPSFSLPLAVLHASMLVRVASDLAVAPAIARWGGLLNAAAILLFGLTMVRAVRAAHRANRTSQKNSVGGVTAVTVASLLKPLAYWRGPHGQGLGGSAWPAKGQPRGRQRMRRPKQGAAGSDRRIGCARNGAPGEPSICTGPRW